MRKKIKFEKREYTIAIQTVAKDNASFRYGSRSNNFLILNEKIDRLMNEQEESIVDNDIYSYIKIRKYENRLIFEIAWLSGGSNNMLRGELEKFEVDFNSFSNFYFGTEENWVTLDKPEQRRKTKTEIQCGERVHNIVSNPALKRKFIKQLMNLQNWNFDKLVVYGDYIDYSFYFEGIVDNKRSMNGGIIFHKDNKEPENLNKGRFQIHT